MSLDARFKALAPLETGYRPFAIMVVSVGFNCENRETNFGFRSTDIVGPGRFGPNRYSYDLRYDNRRERRG